jgi:hypothetical protein
MKFNNYNIKFINFQYSEHRCDICLKKCNFVRSIISSKNIHNSLKSDTLQSLNNISYFRSKNYRMQQKCITQVNYYKI